jgi:fumarate hydratase subunit alpha/L(+)-tartrate dehydratase alpha subunit
MSLTTTNPSADSFYDDIVNVSAFLYKKALTDLPTDVREAIATAKGNEGEMGKKFLNIMVKSVEISDDTGIIICQDTGICIYYVKIGSRLNIDVARLIEALREGIALSTSQHNLRSSIVHPLTRQNLQNNRGDGIPDVHVDFVSDSDELEIRLLPKGSGSENMSFLKMLSPADGINGIKKFILESIVEAGPRPCPPTIVGVGLGGTADLCMSLAKRAVLRPVGEPHPDKEIADLERELLGVINTIGVGPQGLGGATTSFAVHIEYAATHISMNPVAVSIQCWRGERASATINKSGVITYGY